MTTIETELDDVHLKIIDSLIPFYGKDHAEVIANLTKRWIEQNIATPAVQCLIQHNRQAGKLMELTEVLTRI